MKQFFFYSEVSPKKLIWYRTNKNMHILLIVILYGYLINIDRFADTHIILPGVL